jgi:hypothetical protein
MVQLAPEDLRAFQDLLAHQDTSVLVVFLDPAALVVSKVTRVTEALLAPLAIQDQLVQEAYQGQLDSPALPADLVTSVLLASQARAGQSVPEVSSVPWATLENRVIKVRFSS